MCGIAGLYSFDGSSPPDVLGSMTDSLIHRGPDDAGVYSDGPAAIGMRRLSIIGVDNGHQPLFNENGDIALVFNGEIYNYRALKADLEAAGHRFSTLSDVEVVVHLYEQHGDGFLDHLRGMFALALYDRRRQRLLLARDRSGQKPLYYAESGGRLIFASEIKAIHASGLVTKELDGASLTSYLTYGFVVGESTLFEGVRKLPAGCALAITRGGTEMRQYWDLPGTSRAPGSLEEAAQKILELLDASVEKRLMSEVPLGAYLSGGVDSSAVVALMKRHLDQPIQTFCVGFEDSRYDELPHARAVADHFGTRHHELVLRGVSLELLRDLNWHHDEPSGDPAAVPTFCLSRFARQRITVVLTGEGGDETFAGYPHHRHAFRFGNLEGRLPGLGAVARGVSSLEGLLGAVGSARFWKGVWIAGLPLAERHRGWYATYTDVELKRLLDPEMRERVNGALSEPFRALQARVGRREALDQLLYVDSKMMLADQLLMKVDKTTMAASLEARCPLLDQELLEYASALPASCKLSADGGSKLALRHALRGLVQDDILDRPKQGFDVPLATWLERDLRSFVDDGLLAKQAPIGRYLDLSNVRSLWQRFQRRRDMRSAKQIWRLLNLAIWHEIHWPSGLLEHLSEPGYRPLDQNLAGDLFVERTA